MPLSVPGTVRLSEVLGAFSYALDITEGQPEGHCVRACWIGCAIGEALGFSPGEMRALFYAILLKDLGCSSNAARISELYLADDLRFKKSFKLVGSGLPQVLGFVFANTGRNAPFSARAGAIANILKNGPAIAHEMILSRCERGADIARKLRFPDAVANGIYALDEHWDGSGKPDGLKGEDIPMHARIALLSQVAEVFHAHGGPAAASAEIARRSGTWFDPVVAAAFLKATEAPGFWPMLTSPMLEARLFARLDADEELVVDEDYLDDIAEAFGEVVDAKSPFTGGHSVRVCSYASDIARSLDYDPARRRWLRRGALLHDIGKLGVSNTILDKPGSLDDEEWQVMRSHAVQTRMILGRISSFGDLAPLAAAHHERLDGGGYPLGLGSDEIGMETRIITVCDFFDALTADRPYRKAMPVDDALALIGRNVGQAVDPACFDALTDLARGGRVLDA